jgi:hypothetical protein
MENSAAGLLNDFAAVGLRHAPEIIHTSALTPLCAMTPFSDGVEAPATRNQPAISRRRATHHRANTGQNIKRFAEIHKQITAAIGPCPNAIRTES